MTGTTWNRIAKARTVISYVALCAFFSMVAADDLLITHYGGGPGPDGVRPKEFLFYLWWRNISLLVATIGGVISLPRWCASAALVLTLIYTYIRVTGY